MSDYISEEELISKVNEYLTEEQYRMVIEILGPNEAKKVMDDAKRKAREAIIQSRNKQKQMQPRVRGSTEFFSSKFMSPDVRENYLNYKRQKGEIPYRPFITVVSSKPYEYLKPDLSKDIARAKELNDRLFAKSRKIQMENLLNKENKNKMINETDNLFKMPQIDDSEFKVSISKVTQKVEGMLINNRPIYIQKKVVIPVNTNSVRSVDVLVKDVHPQDQPDVFSSSEINAYDNLLKQVGIFEETVKYNSGKTFHDLRIKNMLKRYPYDEKSYSFIEHMSKKVVEKYKKRFLIYNEGGGVTKEPSRFHVFNINDFMNDSSIQDLSYGISLNSYTEAIGSSCLFKSYYNIIIPKVFKTRFEAFIDNKSVLDFLEFGYGFILENSILIQFRYMREESERLTIKLYLIFDSVSKKEELYGVYSFKNVLERKKVFSPKDIRSNYQHYLDVGKKSKFMSIAVKERNDPRLYLIFLNEFLKGMVRQERNDGSVLFLDEKDSLQRHKKRKK